MCLRSYANNKGADQPAHLGNLISTFVVRYLDSIIPTCLSQNFKTEQAGLCLTWLKTLKTGFLVTGLILFA